MAGLVADRGARCCLMHMLGEPRTMQDDPRYDDVVDDVKAFLEERVEFAVARGRRARTRIELDPGIGFGKTVEHNLELLRRLDEIVALGLPGRRRHVAQVVHRPPRPGAPDAARPRARDDRDATCSALERGATVFRVHDVAPTRQALTVAAATLRRDGA